MALLGFSGFETGDTSEWTTVTAGISAQTTVVNSNGGAYAATSTTLPSEISRNITAQATLYVRFYLRLHSLSTSISDASVFLCSGSGGNISGVGIETDSSGNPSIVLIDFVTSSVVTTASAISLDTWHRIEFKTVISATVGILELYVDGILIQTASSLNTGTNNVTGVACYYTNVGGGSPSGTVYWDDVAYSSTGYPGVGGCLARQFNQTTPHYNSWTKSTGSVWNCWDDTPFSATTNCSISTSAAKQTGVTNFSNTTDTGASGHGPGFLLSFDTVNAAKISWIGKTSSSDTNVDSSIFRTPAGASGTDTTTAGVAYTTADTYQETQLSTTPTTAQILNCEVGLSKSSGTKTHTVEDVWLMVDATLVRPKAHSWGYHKPIPTTKVPVRYFRQVTHPHAMLTATSVGMVHMARHFVPRSKLPFKVRKERWIRYPIGMPFVHLAHEARHFVPRPKVPFKVRPSRWVRNPILPYFVGRSQANNNNSGANVNITTPPFTQSGDMMVLVVVSNGVPPTGPGTGWQFLGTSSTSFPDYTSAYAMESTGTATYTVGGDFPKVILRVYRGVNIVDNSAISGTSTVPALNPTAQNRDVYVGFFINALSNITSGPADLVNGVSDSMQWNSWDGDKIIANKGTTPGAESVSSTGRDMSFGVTLTFAVTLAHGARRFIPRPKTPFKVRKERWLRYPVGLPFVRLAHAARHFIPRPKVPFKVGKERWIRYPIGMPFVHLAHAARQFIPKPKTPFKVRKARWIRYPVTAIVGRLAHAARQFIPKPKTSFRIRKERWQRYPIGLPFVRLAHAARRFTPRPKLPFRVRKALWLRYAIGTPFLRIARAGRHFIPRPKILFKVRKALWLRYPIGIPFVRLAHAARRFVPKPKVPFRVQKERWQRYPIGLPFVRLAHAARRFVPKPRLPFHVRKVLWLRYSIGVPFVRLAHAARKFVPRPRIPFRVRKERWIRNPSGFPFIRLAHAARRFVPQPKVPFKVHKARWIRNFVAPTFVHLAHTVHRFIPRPKIPFRVHKERWIRNPSGFPFIHLAHAARRFVPRPKVPFKVRKERWLRYAIGMPFVHIARAGRHFIARPRLSFRVHQARWIRYPVTVTVGHLAHAARRFIPRPKPLFQIRKVHLDRVPLPVTTIFIDHAYASGGGFGSPSINISTWNLQANDLLVAFYVCTASVDPGVPTGFTDVGYTYNEINLCIGLSYALWTSQTTITWPAQVNAEGILYVFRGPSAIDSFTMPLGHGGTSGGTTANLSVPGATQTVNEPLVCAWAANTGANGPGDFTTSFSAAAPSGPITDGYRILASAGTTPPTENGNANFYWTGVGATFRGPLSAVYKTTQRHYYKPQPIIRFKVRKERWVRYPIGLPFVRLAHTARRFIPQPRISFKVRKAHWLRNPSGFPFIHIARAGRRFKPRPRIPFAVRKERWLRAPITLQFLRLSHAARRFVPRPKVPFKVRKERWLRYPIELPFARLAHAARHAIRDPKLPSWVRKARWIRYPIGLPFEHVARAGRRFIARPKIRFAVRKERWLRYPAGLPFVHLVHAVRHFIQSKPTTRRISRTARKIRALTTIPLAFFRRENVRRKPYPWQRLFRWRRQWRDIGIRIPAADAPRIIFPATLDMTIPFNGTLDQTIIFEAELNQSTSFLARLS